MKTKELKAHNLPYDRKINHVINAKPFFHIILLGIIGIILTFINSTFFIGISLIVICLMILFLLPNRIIMEFSDDYVVIYNKANHNECMMIYYEDVMSWRYNRGVYYDELIINLEDGNKEVVEAFSKMLYENYMNYYLSDKRIKKKA